MIRFDTMTFFGRVRFFFAGRKGTVAILTIGRSGQVTTMLQRKGHPLRQKWWGNRRRRGLTSPL